MYHVIVVPDGLQANKDGTPTTNPSFVYRTICNAVLQFYNTHENTHIYLAPANNFGGKDSEQISAKKYLIAHGVQQSHIITCTPKTHTYIDTMGNAVYLKRYLQHKNMPLPTQHSHLFVAKYHRKRAVLCFTYCGFQFDKVHSIDYVIPKHEYIVKRLFYYRYPIYHRAYEILAYIRDYGRILIHKIYKKS